MVQTIKKVLKNIGRYSQVSLSASEEHQFFNDIKSIIQKKYDCLVEVLIEKNSTDKKADQALPGKPALMIR